MKYGKPIGFTRPAPRPVYASPFVTIEMREENGAAPGDPDSYEPTED